MKYNKILFILASCYALSAVAEDDGYPKTREERRSDEMGSIVGGEGWVFRPGKVRNETTKTADSKVNKFLWQASLESLDMAPLVISDNKTGVLSTDWYSDKAHPNHTMKVMVNITDNIIAPESIEVKIQQKVLKGGRWLDDDLDHAIKKISTETKILRRAKELYINDAK
jgi:hypothetical protein